MIIALLLASEALDLHLICPGAGTDTKVNATFADAHASDGSSADATIYHRRAIGFEDQLEVELADGIGRVRLPRHIVPPLHGGKEGWFDVKGLAVGRDTIDAEVPINPINAPRLHINRITGIVTVEGRDGSFTGKCSAYDPAKVERAF